jgi:HPt (histidine-containing phosphotransfer) domain-containing protein
MNDTRSGASLVPRPDFLEFLALQRADYRNGLQDKLAHMSALWSLVVEGHDDRGPIGELERAAHSLAGSGATFGFAELGASARALELAVGRVLESAAPPTSAQRAEILAAIAAVTDRIPPCNEPSGSKPC